MTNLISKQCEYALRILVHLVNQPDEGLITSHQIATDLKIPQHYAAKTLHVLTGHHYLLTRRGRGGGYTINPAARHTDVLEIIKTLDGPEFMSVCLAGCLESCQDPDCPLLVGWNPVRQSMLKTLHNMHLSDFSVPDTQGLTHPLSTTHFS